MPELPEVETVAEELRSSIIGRKIQKVTCRTSKLRYPLAAKTLAKVCRNNKIVEISRRGKYMIWHLESGACLIVHLGMSGRFQLVSAKDEKQKHEHVIFSFGKEELRYEDPRRFGAIVTIENGAWQEHKLIANLGYEPLDKISAQQIWEKAQRKTIAIKQMLMDQKIIVGVGNIYANESLFRSKIHPLTSANIITVPQWRKLLKNIRQILTTAIENRGTTLADHGYQTLEGDGGFQQHLQVYGRADQPCVKCHTEIQSVFLQNRSTFYCPKCQPQR